MRFSRQEYWSQLPFPPPGDLSDPGIKPWSPALQADSLLSEPPGKSLDKPVCVCRGEGWEGVQGCASQVELLVKNPPANAGDVKVVGSIPGLGRSTEEGMATHFSILAWEIPWTDEPGRLQSVGSQRVRHD